MLRRLWLVLSIAWAVVIGGLCLTDRSVSSSAWAVAIGPFVLGVLLWPVARWVLTARWGRGA